MERPSKSWPPLRTLRCNANYLAQIKAAWTWESCNGVKMNSGFGIEDSKYLRLKTGDCKIVENEELVGEKRVAVTGTESLALMEIHSMKFSKVEADFAHEANCKRTSSTIENLESIF